MELINKIFTTNYIKSLIEEDEEIARFRKESEDRNIPIIHEEVANFIKVILHLLKPLKILELGTAVGFSSFFMAKIIDNDNLEIKTIERRDSFVDEASKNLERLNYKGNIEILPGDALEILENLEEKFDLVFIDAAKSKYLDFLPYCFNLLKKDGIIISDNVLYKGMIANDDLVERRQKTIVRKMRKYLKTISNHPSMESSVLPLGDGLAITVKKGETYE
ncbi:O-methyltransferase [Halanaerobium sp.]|uniref:O-methyltransferase n=1 Tax=Halanaerobium sp. TaxID=1895664 RepID=UPI000DE67B63|nr:O-methyltransferase [Halanaerobium sp.]MBG0764877.1 O-methyltransferase [Tissierellales bacterium]PUU95021.1 MAG: O-methyltransferase [Halanaerobium sp.]HCX03600.1 O-methyltransferase [Clostridiales bacterium]